jgi:uncharacterized protein YndB with AHSA1/START domain
LRLTHAAGNHASCVSHDNFATENAHSFLGEYVELVPGELISYTDEFDDARLPGVMHVTIKLRPVSFGTEIEQSGIPEKC